MAMALYAEARYPVRADLEAVHEKQLRGLGRPGTWGTGVQHLAVAAATRKAGVDAGLLDAPDDDKAPTVDQVLPKVASDVITKLAAMPAAFEMADYEGALSGGLTDAEYVEMVGIVARMVAIDVFARGIGVPLRPLPETAEAGRPSRKRPQAAVIEQAWVPTIPNAPAGGAEAAELYGGQQLPYIIRSLSLVPEEYHVHREMEGVQYLPLGRVFDYAFEPHEGLSRPQMEIVAGRISAINECFY